MNAELIAEYDRLSKELAEIDGKIDQAKPAEISKLVERKGTIVQAIAILDARRASDEIADIKKQMKDFEAQHERARLASNEAAERRQAVESKWMELNAQIINDSVALERKSIDVDALITKATDLYPQMLRAIVDVNHHAIEMIVAQGALPGLRERLANLERQLARS